MRTWDQNKVAMNQLWPQCQWSDEERRLLNDDLGGLDQDTLYDALRNVKRSRDTLYPQIKWILDAYRELTSARKQASSSRKDFEVHKSVPVDADESRRLASEFVGMIEGASPSDFGMIEGLVLDKVQQLKIDMLPARRVLMYARKRLLGQDAMFGRVSADGDVEPAAFGKAS